MTPVNVVALGDSVSEGVGDPGKGRLLGWIHHLTTDPEIATGLNLPTNFALTGAKICDVRRDQLPQARAMDADLYICVIGVNDVMSSSFRRSRFEADYDYVIDALMNVARRGVLTMTLHDVVGGIPLPASKLACHRDRAEQANRVIERVSAKYGAWLLEARDALPMRGSGMLSIDRLHPNRRGHRYLASMAAAELHAHGVVPQPPKLTVPPAQPLRARSLGAARHGLWLGRHLTAPVVDHVWFRAARRTDGGSLTPLS
ncbi:lysophospholipase L1-like esterase [Antricoccus suffuscus]|uniref:Lysophospholipase L1-like esterase n=1 Tax=Antricoccus suffuscus TaxID=1629062 RepID=A0A2T1A481_9ACTN|nr:SGNH/GDSL hydrolase family protein [Antricoccus suffuscus]PRZ43128.1 lysophospholipase L1-like esterase [Antricoccus suffuscus]